MSVQSILVVNDYLTLCTLKDKKCPKSFLVRKYLNYKISKKLKSSGKGERFNLFYTILGLLVFK